MIASEFRRFVVVGVVSLLADFAVYRGCLVVVPELTNACKAAGFIVGTTVAYLMNRHWTFGHSNVSTRLAIPRFVVLYGLTLGINVAVNAVALALIPEPQSRILLAFLLASGASAVGNFAGMKWFVFRPARSPL